ncbi:alanyl-tRNA editing protein Aarsd1 [Asbolus verrucosus]|uniref:Alanyl-tRNA editing protein Aarsd1 n=1 Tax=Asbolus verrucosus TaxID=1661398 RepID=A0A482W264_ASBVE|nr:alanyl-tRNA editing protein Aarsd1 [Asbolus verrucosus]
MVFKCQENSFLKEFTAKVVSCEKSEFTTTVDGKKTKINGYEVILEDTVLFPEGGGQPSDHGFINDQKVHQVIRRGDKAVHFIEKPLNVGEEVKEVIDWDRRLNHMQQHSGQHLITAILDREFKFYTVSWYLGEDVSYIELDTPSITQEEINKTEDICNQLIREYRKVFVNVFDENTPEEELENFRSARGLPADHKGDIRVVTIDGIESNMCCGTHVTNLSQLQVVKLLHAEKNKRKDKTLLYFLVGNRVINKLHQCLNREQKLTGLLKTNPVQHPEFVEKQIENIKSLNKNLQSVLKDLAIYEANKLKNSTEKYFVLHRKEADTTFMNILIKELGTTNIFLFLSVGDERGAGNIVLYGEDKAIADLGHTFICSICELLGGKGAGKGNKFQAKVTNMANRKEAERLIKEYFK